MLDYLESPYILAVSAVVGLLLLIVFYSFVSDGSSESGKTSQRFILPCMINPTTLDTEDEDEQVPQEDLSKVKGEVNIENEPYSNEGDGPVILEEQKLKDSKITDVDQDDEKEDPCIKNAAEAEKKIKSSLSEEELLNERQIQQQQLAAIFEIMKNKSEKFGDTSLNDVHEQMKMYR